jgi:hypothetical protein
MYTGDPQVGQNARVLTLPVSAATFHRVASPLCLTPSRGKVRYEPWPAVAVVL